MSHTVIIPARLASTRLPGKPLADLGGKPMVVRVAERAALSGAAQAQQSAEPAPRAAQAEAAALPAINVNAQREENVGYQGVRTTVGKSPQLLRDVPQSVTVVTEPVPLVTTTV